jgi:peptide/nickel transport system substrate-binding protein
MTGSREPCAARARGSRPESWLRRMGVLMVSLALLGSACTATPESEVGGDGGGENGEVKNPGTFVHALDGEPEGLDPARVTAGGYGDRVIIQVYETLVDIPPESPEPVPMLATEVPTQENGLVSRDGLTYTFPIREGVTFHDGSDLTAEDVEYSWDRAMTMNLPESQASALTDIVAKTRVVDDFTFEVTLKEPAAWFLSSVVYSIPASVVSQDAVEAHGGVTAGEPNQWMDTNMAGTGPHEFISWERNEQLTFEIFEDYWGEPAPLDARFAVVPDQSAEVLGFKAGDYDLLEPVPQFVAELEGTEGACFDDEGFLLEPLHLAFNLNIPVDKLPNSDTIPADFFHDVRVRQAFNYAFDYEAFVEGGLEGFGRSATYLPPGVLGYDPNGPKYSQDLDRAEELFRETGWWDRGFTVSVLVESGNPTFTPVGLILKDSLEAMNPKFRVNVLEVAEAQFDEAHGTVPFEYAMWIKNADPFFDPHFYMWTYFHPDGPWGERLGYRNGYENPDAIADLIDRASVETDVDKRAQLYREVLPLIKEDPMWIWAADERNVQIYRCWVENFTYNPLWRMPRWRFYDKG